MPSTYTTISDDRWDAIALKTLGSEMYVTQLMQANRQYLGYYAFPDGIVLTLPEITVDEDAELPAWRRG